MFMTLASEGPNILQRMDPALLIPLAAIVLGCGVAIVVILGGIIGSVLRTRAIEATKRELAAYVAEGSMQPEQAVAIINAGKNGEDDE